MASLIEKSALADLLPLSRGRASLSARAAGPMTSIAPLNGAEAKVGAALARIGLGWPGPNASVAKGAAACLCSGRGQAFLIGCDAPDLTGLAALTDQSDGWAAMTLEGPSSRDVLARLFAVDLRDGAFPVGTVVRSGLQHLMALLWRRDTEAWDIFVFRSMAKTAVHELDTAMSSVAARAEV